MSKPGQAARLPSCRTIHTRAVQADDPYGVLADRYATHNETGPYNALYERPALLALLGAQHGRDVLDLGCGPGLVAEALLTAGAIVTAIDRSPAMLDVAASRLGERATVLQHNIEDPLPFPENTFDTVTAGLVLHYLPDWRALLAEVHRVLRPHGRLVASVHHPLTDQRVPTLEPAGHGPYLQSYPITERWELDGVTAEVRFWHHPLGQMSSWIRGAGLALTDVVEPRPVTAMATAFPDAYDRLSAQPAFLLLAARKPGSVEP